MLIRIYELLRSIINAVMAIIAFFLLMRIILLFFSASQGTPFVSWVMSVSGVLISPFAGIVPNPFVSTGILDIVSIITLFAYLIIGYILLSILQGLSEPQIMEEERQASVHYHEIDWDEDLEDHPHTHRFRRR